MIEIKTNESNSINASFTFLNDIEINEEERNLIVFDIKDENDLNNTKSNFGKIIAGINKSDFVYYNEAIAFDNDNYFNNRIYIDTKIKYTKTLSEEKISNEIIGEYGKAFDDKCFKKLVHDLMIRSHYKKSNFDTIGLTLTNLSLALSIYTNSIINLHNNDSELLKKVLDIKNDLLYGLTVLTKCDKNSLNAELIKHFDNIYLVTKKNEGLLINKVEKETINMLNIGEVNYEK